MTDICQNRHRANPESVEAFNSTPPDKREAIRAWVYEFAVKRGTIGITADEVSAEAGAFHNVVAPRISELRMDGKLIPTGERRLTRLGRRAMVLVADVCWNTEGAR